VDDNNVQRLSGLPVRFRLSRTLRDHAEPSFELDSMQLPTVCDLWEFPSVNVNLRNPTSSWIRPRQLSPVMSKFPRTSTCNLRSDYEDRMSIREQKGFVFTFDLFRPLSQIFALLSNLILLEIDLPYCAREIQQHRDTGRTSKQPSVGCGRLTDNNNNKEKPHTYKHYNKLI